MKESEIQRSILQWLEYVGLEPLRNNSGKVCVKAYTNKKGQTRQHWVKMGREGSADIVLCTHKGRWCEIEVKTKTGQLSIAQKKRMKYIDSIGGIYIVARSLDDVLLWENELLNK